MGEPSRVKVIGPLVPYVAGFRAELEAGLGRGAVLVDEPTQYVVASNIAERRGSRGHCTDR